MSNYVDDARKIIFMNVTANSVDESEMLFKAVFFNDVQAFDDLKRLNVFQFLRHENGFSLFKFNKHRHEDLVKKNHENNLTPSQATASRGTYTEC